MDSGFDDIEYVVDFGYEILNDFENGNRETGEEKRERDNAQAGELLMHHVPFSA